MCIRDRTWTDHDSIASSFYFKSNSLRTMYIWWHKHAPPLQDLSHDHLFLIKVLQCMQQYQYILANMRFMIVSYVLPRLVVDKWIEFKLSVLIRDDHLCKPSLVGNWIWVQAVSFNKRWLDVSAKNGRQLNFEVIISLICPDISMLLPFKTCHMITCF